MLDLQDVKLPSVNHKYIIARGRMILCRQYREFKTYLISKVLRVEIPGPYRVEIIVEQYSDIDNGLKIVLDSLTGNCIDDDRNILELIIHKTKLKRGKSGKLDVFVETIEA